MKKMLLLLLVVFTCGVANETRAQDLITKPNLNTISGPNNAHAMSERTVASIYEHIGKSLEVNRSQFGYRTADLGAKLQKLFGNHSVICALTIRPSGEPESIVIKKSSGSEELDGKAIKLLRKAAPFAKNNYPDKLTWNIEFPVCSVHPAWFPTESN